MSTRANYVFITDEKTVTTFYVHHDGYPEGAAEYFQKALLLGNGKISSPDVFLRANSKCKISAICGDIEYLYEFEISTQIIKCYKIYWGANDKMLKRLYHKEDIYGFINKHFTIFSSNETLHEYNYKFSYKDEKDNEKRIMSENSWHYISVRDRYDIVAKTKPTCLALVYNKLREATEELIENTMNYGTDNPNYENLVTYQSNLMQQLKVLTQIERNEIKEETCHNTQN